jgi:putative SOS response-associated peptidase YedK
MCGRYYRKGSKQQIAEALCAMKIEQGMPELLTSYNVAPTTHQPVIRHTRDGAEREMLLMRWGLVPFFTKSLADLKWIYTFNARAEMLACTAAWSEPFHKGRRCLVPADGFYQWKVEGEVIDPKFFTPAYDGVKRPLIKPQTRQPYVFTVISQPTFAFAGLWDAWHDKSSDAWLQSFTIITTTPNDLTGTVHNRMPVILHERHYDEWLLREGPIPAHLMKPFPADEMAMMPVSKDVGNVRNDHPELLNSK